jgi:hypothetical protein
MAVKQHGRNDQVSSGNSRLFFSCGTLHFFPAYDIIPRVGPEPLNVTHASTASTSRPCYRFVSMCRFVGGGDINLHSFIRLVVRVDPPSIETSQLLPPKTSCYDPPLLSSLFTLTLGVLYHTFHDISRLWEEAPSHPPTHPPNHFHVPQHFLLFENGRIFAQSVWQWPVPHPRARKSQVPKPHRVVSRTFSLLRPHASAREHAIYVNLGK